MQNRLKHRTPIPTRNKVASSKNLIAQSPSDAVSYKKVLSKNPSTAIISEIYDDERSIQSKINSLKLATWQKNKVEDRGND